jgi:aryl-alcohol dehydrogenase-like predicted oxidoreductase
MRYKIFGQHTGLRVSELALGGGSLGTGWGYGAERDEVRRILDGYAEAGGNFIDTADVYQFGQSERLIGEFVGAERDHFVIATKYTNGASADAGISVVGNSRKTMIQAVEASLERLGTDSVDLYWVHRREKSRATEMKRIVHYEDSPQKTAIVDALHAVAKDTGSNPGQVAIAWVGAKGIIPIIGPRTRAQLDDNLAAVSVRLSADQIRRLDEVSAVPLGFPHEMLADPRNRQRLAGGKLDLVEVPAAPVA